MAIGNRQSVGRLGRFTSIFYTISIFVRSILQRLVLNEPEERNWNTQFTTKRNDKNQHLNILSCFKWDLEELEDEKHEIEHIFS